MGRVCRLVTVALACLAAVVLPSCSGGSAKARLELRRAQEAPADGLTAAVEPMGGRTVYLHLTPELTEADVQIARLLSDSEEPDPVVELVFTPEGSRKMGELTDAQQGESIAVLINGRVVSAPKVHARITGRVQITGKFTHDEAERLVRSINAN